MSGYFFFNVWPPRGETRPSAAVRAAKWLAACGLAASVCWPAQASELEALFEAGRYETFLSQAREAAQAGEPDALFLLGKAHHLGQGVEKDADAARRYYELAHEKGSARATHNLGVLALDGKDRPQAIAYFKQALSRGLAQPTWLNLAKAYEPPSPASVMQAPGALWLSRLSADAYAQAWKLDASPALVNQAGRMYLQAYQIARAMGGSADGGLQARLDEEEGTELSVRDFQAPALRQAALSWLERGMALSDGVSWTNYGVLLFEEENFDEAKRAFEQGVALGTPLAHYHLGVIAERGAGDGPDREAASHHYEQAFLLGEKRARDKAVYWLNDVLMATKEPDELERGAERLSALAEPGRGNPASGVKTRLAWVRHLAQLREQARPLPEKPLRLHACGLDLDQPYGRIFNLGWNSSWRLVAYDDENMDWPVRLEIRGRVDEQGCALTDDALPGEVRALIEQGAQMGLFFPNYTLPLLLREEQGALVLDIAEPAKPIPFN